MNLSYEISIIVGNTTKLKVFRKILHSRILSRAQLKKDKSMPDDIELILDELESLGLVNKKSSTIQDFDKFYPTRKGLVIEKMVK